MIRAAGNACKNLLRAPHHSRRGWNRRIRSLHRKPRTMPYRKPYAPCRTGTETPSPSAAGGYSAEEAARLLGITPDAVRKRTCSAGARHAEKTT